jgi:hypothetical protein
MLKNETAVVYFLEGHGETVILESILGRFQKGGYIPQNFSLIHEESVPDDAVTIVVNSPEKDLTAEEIDAIRTYIDGGGNAILIASVDTVDTPNYDALIEEYQGINGKIEKLKNIMPSDELNAVEYLENLRELTKEGRESFFEDQPELQSDTDAILSLIDSTLYKLKELKENVKGSKLSSFITESLCIGI